MFGEGYGSMMRRKLAARERVTVRREEIILSVYEGIALFIAGLVIGALL